MGLIAAGEGKYSMYVHARREHPPPHVHVYIRGNGVVRVNLLTLATLDEPPKGQRRTIIQFVKEHLTDALNEWKELNG